MAIVDNTFTRYDAKGLREQLSDVIHNISPEDTPVSSAIGKGSVKQTLWEWQTDSLAAAVTTNAQLEGDDITSFPAISPTVRVGNYTQISYKLLVISGTLEKVDKAGRQSELAYQISKRGREMKRDMEATILNNQPGNAGGPTTARTTATLGAWVKTNVDKAAGDGDNPTWTSGVPSAGRTDGTMRAFTETILKSVAQKVWTSGGSMKMLSVGPVNKTKLSGFSGVVTRSYDISSPKPVAVIAAVDVFVTDWGTLRVVPNRFQRERDVWLLDPEYLSIKYLRPFAVESLAKTGDATKKMLIAEWGLEVGQEAALGLAADLTIT